MALENNFAHILKDQKEIIITYKIDPEYDQFGNCYKYSTYVILNKHILPFVEIVAKCYSVDRSVLAFLESLDNEDRFPLVVYSKLNMFQNFEYNIQRAAERKWRFIPNINSDNAPHILKFPKENQPTWILGTAKFEGIVFVKLYNKHHYIYYQNLLLIWWFIW